MTKLKTMRKLSGISQVQLATNIGVKPPCVCDMERKGIYDTRTAKKYAKALNCSPVFLLEELG